MICMLTVFVSRLYMSQDVYPDSVHQAELKYYDLGLKKGVSISEVLMSYHEYTATQSVSTK